MLELKKHISGQVCLLNISWHSHCALIIKIINSMKIFFVILLITYLFSCGNSSSVKNLEPNKNKSATDSLINSGAAYADSEFAKGAKLIAANDCLTCHQLKESSVGPSYFDISKKYHTNAGNIDNLANEIINGTQGFVWGNKEMTAHSAVTYADAVEMVKYILSLSPDTP